MIQSEFSGVVDKILVEEGDRVEEGQLLVQLRDERQRIGLELSRDGLVRAKALANETQVLLENARRELERMQIAGEALPRKDLENIEDTVRRIEASLEAQIAERSRAEEEVRLREHELGETALSAPFAGTVTEIHVSRGESLRPMDTPVIDLVDLDRLYADLLLPSNYVLSVRTEQSIPVQVEGEWMGAEGQLHGPVMYVNPTIDASSRTFRVKVRIPNKGGLVRPGMLVQAQFPE